MFDCVKIVTLKRVKIAAGVITFLYLSWSVSLIELSTRSKSLLVAWIYSEDISCHYSMEDDALPSAEGNDFSPSYKSIFFLETSCRRNLTSRQLCAIESAARAHPDYQVHVLFTGPISKKTLEHISLRQKIKNVRFARIHIEEFTKFTPPEEVVTSGTLNMSKWGIEHTSDLLKYLILFKWSGIYLDTDVVVAKHLNTLGENWAARESDSYVGAGAFAFSMDVVGRSVASDAITEIQMNFRNDLWGHNGPGVLTRVLSSRCNTSDVTLMNSTVCLGIEVYGPKLFYPISWSDRRKYFEAGTLDNKDAYIYHVWNHSTKNCKTDKDSPYAHLARSFCPTTYTLYGDQFGL